MQPSAKDILASSLRRQRLRKWLTCWRKEQRQRQRWIFRADVHGRRLIVQFIQTGLSRVHISSNIDTEPGGCGAIGWTSAMKTVMIIAGVTVGLVMTACELTPVMVAPQTEAAREQARQARVT